MPDVAAGDVFQVSIRSTLFDQRVITTFHYQLDTVTGSINYESAATGLDTVLSDTANLLDKYMDCTQADLLIDEIWYQKISPTRLYIQKKTKGVTGNRIADSGTANLATSIERRAVNANRRSVGRIGPPTAADAGSVVDGNVTAGLKTALVALAAQMLAGVASNTGLLLWSPVLYGPPRAATEDKPALPELIQPLVACVAMESVRVQRRRTLRVGE